VTSLKALILKAVTISAVLVSVQSASRAQTLASPTQRVLFDRSAFFGDSTPVPNWSNGLLVSHETQTFEEDTANVRWYDRSGQQAGSASIWFPGAKRLGISEAVAAPDGTILVAGHSDKSMDPEVNLTTSFSFLARIDGAGKILKVLPTPGYHPVNLCAAPDGTVWTYGNTGADANHRPINGDLLRHFDIEKGQLASFLPHTTFGRFPSPMSLTSMSCGSDTLALYIPGPNGLVMMKYDAASPQVYSVSANREARFFGLASVGTDLYTASGHHGSYGLYRLSKNDSALTAKWVAVSGTTGSADNPCVVQALWGVDSSSLVVGKLADPADLQALYWVQPTSSPSRD
jgi:hypothetical protein